MAVRFVPGREVFGTREYLSQCIFVREHDSVPSFFSHSLCYDPVTVTTKVVDVALRIPV